MTIKSFIFILLIFVYGCNNNANLNIETTKPIVNDSLTQTDTLSNEEVTHNVVDTFDTSFHLFNIISTGFRSNYTEFIPLSEALQSGLEPEQSIIPDSFLGDNAKTHPDTILILKGKHRMAALEFAGIKKTDSVFIYNFNQNTVFAQSVSQLPLIAFVNVYGANVPVMTTDYVFGLDILDIEGRKQRNYEEQELASIHNSNPFILGGAERIKWNEIDTIAYPDSLKKSVRDYKTDRCFQFKFEDLNYFCRTYVSNQDTRGFKIDVVKNKKAILTLYSFSGEGSEPMLSMLYEQPVFNNWTGRLFRNMPPMIYNLYSLSFGCPKVFFIQEKELYKYVICDNRH